MVIVLHLAVVEMAVGCHVLLLLLFLVVAFLATDSTIFGG